MAYQPTDVGIVVTADVEKAYDQFNRITESLNKVNKAVSESNRSMRYHSNEYDAVAKHVENLTSKEEALKKAIAAQEVVVYATKESGATEAKLKGEKAKLKKYKDELEKLNGVMSEYREKLDALNTPYYQLVRQQKAAEESVKALSEQYKSSVITTGKESEKSRELAEKLRLAAQESDRLEQQIAELDGETKELTGDTKELADATEDAGKKQSGMSQTLADVSHALNIAREVWQVLRGVVTEVGEAYIGTDNAIRQTVATFGTNQISVEGMNDRLKEYNATLEHQYYSTEQEAEALKYFALAGYDVESSMEALGTALALAQVSGNDMQTVVDQLTDNMNALGIEGVVTWKQMADVMAQTSRTTNTNVQQLGEAYGVVGALWTEFPDDIYALSTALGVLANAGYKGEAGGTKLRNMLTKLVDPTKQGAKWLKKLGVDIYNADGSTRSMVDILKDLDKGLEGLSDEKRQKVLTDLFNTRDLAAAEAILRAIESGNWDEVAASVGEAEGAMTEMAGTINEGLGGSVVELQAKWADLKAYLGEVFEPAAIGGIDELIRLINGLGNTIRYWTDEEYRLSLSAPDEVTKSEMEVKDYLATVSEANAATRKMSEEAQKYLRQTGQENAAVWYDMVEYLDWLPREHWVKQIADELAVSTERAAELYAELVKVGSRTKVSAMTITPKVDISQVENATKEAQRFIDKLSQTITVKANIKVPKVGIITDAAGNISAFRKETEVITPYARGGLLDRPTLALMGEAGREAVVPLQNNLEWVDELARVIAPAMVRAMNTYNRTDNRNFSRTMTVNQTINASRTDPFDLYLKARSAY